MRVSTSGRGKQAERAERAGLVASFRRRLTIPVAGLRPLSRVRRLREPEIGVPSRGRIVLRVRGSTLR